MDGDVDSVSREELLPALALWKVSIVGVVGVLGVGVEVGVGVGVGVVVVGAYTATGGGAAKGRLQRVRALRPA